MSQCEAHAVGLETATEPGTRDRILDAALQLFVRRGYAGATLGAVARNAGVTAGALYWYVKSKQDLCFVVIEREYQRFYDHLELTKSEKDPVAALTTFVHRYVDYQLRDGELSKTFGWSQLANELAVDQARRVDDMVTPVIDKLRSILAAGVEAGAFAVDHETVTSLAIITLCEHVHTWYDPAGTLSRDEVADLYANLALRMVGAGGALC
ncbi:TetR/AcrR family transcriptional regulator [Saccharomonospora sp. NPDC046836]|uniref:TetR/AcrR family transcriptional regulator n=1 Tax=Saccharomonospora sp. NPDC046836 TaxID=3156921 RepID=UPI00340C209B